MNLFLWTMILIIFIYTAGFSINLWKDGNKVGSTAVLLLAISIVVLPFFSIFKN